MRNETDETVRVLMFSTVVEIAATVYPDSDKIGVWTGNEDDNLLAFRSSNVDYYAGEPGGRSSAAPGPVPAQDIGSMFVQPTDHVPEVIGVVPWPPAFMRSNPTVPVALL